MFIGRYYHTVEEKGRVSLPKPFREQCQSWVISRGLDGGIFLFPENIFHQQIQSIAQRTFTKKRDRDFVRYLTNDAYQLSIDANGRVLLPEYLKKYANLSKHVVIVGSFTYIEIWDVETYHTYIQKIESSAESISESIEYHAPTSSS